MVLQAAAGGHSTGATLDRSSGGSGRNRAAAAAVGVPTPLNRAVRDVLILHAEGKRPG